MTQITLRGISDALDRAIRERAQRENKSINRTVTEILAEALGVEPGGRKKRDLSDLAGSWSEQQVRELEQAMAPFERIDDTEWQ